MKNGIKTFACRMASDAVAFARDALLLGAELIKSAAAWVKGLCNNEPCEQN